MHIAIDLAKAKENNLVPSCICTDANAEELLTATVVLQICTDGSEGRTDLVMLLISNPNYLLVK